MLTREKKTAKPLSKVLPGPVLTGAVCAQYKRCGKANCKCARGTLHGPYYYRFSWHRGRMIKQYIPLARVEEVTAACAKHRALQAHLRDGRRRYRQMLSDFKLHLKEMGL